MVSSDMINFCPTYNDSYFIRFATSSSRVQFEYVLLKLKVKAGSDLSTHSKTKSKSKTMLF